MQLNTQSEIPIYLQIAAGLEDGIFIGAYPEETQVPSTTELSVALQIIRPRCSRASTAWWRKASCIRKGEWVCLSVKAHRRKSGRKGQDAFFESYIRPLVRRGEKAGPEPGKAGKVIERVMKNECH